MRRRIYAIIAMASLANALFAQQPKMPSKIVSWEPYNSYVVAGAAAALGTIAISKYPLEITPQVGPSINWFRYDQQALSDFYSTFDIQPNFGHVWGYSIGALIGTDRPGLNFKTGLFLESKGRSYSHKGWAQTYVYSDGYGHQSKIWLETEGHSRLSYFTIPLMIGMKTEGQKAVFSLDLGGFLSLPIAERHTSTTNGVEEELEPMQTIGLDAGLLANIGLSIPITETLRFRTDLRHAAGLTNVQEMSAFAAYTQSVQILFGVSFRPKSK